MWNPISRRAFISSVGAVGAVTGSVLASSKIRANELETNEWQGIQDDDFIDPIHPSSIPDPEHLSRRGRGWRVLPNGFDDHDNLEWSLRNTAPGGVVKLVPGVYKLGRPIVVADFDGTLAGAGAGRTTLTCTDVLNFELWGGTRRGQGKERPEASAFSRRQDRSE